MAGTCNSVRCLPTSALSRAEVTGDFRGSLMRRSSKVRSTRRRDCGDYQAAAWTTCSAAELNRRPRYKRAMLALWLMTALEAVIRALAKFYYRSHCVFAKTCADYQSSHETHLVIEEQFMPEAASLPNPAQRCRLRRAAPSTWWNDHETPSPRPAHRLIPSQFIQDRQGVYDQRE
jgi:hypothetical protein